jgi:hypothetical protein
MAVEDRQQSSCAQIVADQECREPRDTNRQARVAQGSALVALNRPLIATERTCSPRLKRHRPVGRRERGKTTMPGELVDIAARLASR